MFIFNNDIISKNAGTGATRKVLSYSENLMLCEMSLKKDAVIPEHFHHHEQITYVISGSCRITSGDETRDIKTGDSVMIPGNVPHKVIVLEDSKCIDIFSPAREDFI